MTSQLDPSTAQLPCHVCGYDLRVHGLDAKCPECGASVAEAREVAKVPIRPAWRDSDPRWRRRMIVGAWVLVLVPLVDTMRTLRWAEHVPVPTVFDLAGRSLNDTMLIWPGVYAPLAFCIGVGLLCSRERGRRRSRLDWTRRWGVLLSFVVMLLSAVGVLFICSLVMVGIAAVFTGMPPIYQPRARGLFVFLGSNYLRYGPQPTVNVMLVLVAASSVAMLLACVALYEALRSISRSRFALYVLVPLAMFALLHLGQIAQYWVFRSMPPSRLEHYGNYFWPELFTRNFGNVANQVGQVAPLDVFVATLKWLLILAIAIWLSVAQIATWRRSTDSDSERRA